MERCGCWLMAGALWWSPAVWRANEGLGLAADCATPINLARGGVFWGAAGMCELLESFLGPATEECVTVLSTVFCQVCLSVSNKAWQMVRGCAECRRVLQCVAVASKTRELRLRAMSLFMK
jgi:hypothetical protein